MAQSGAGAEVTALAESLQAYACAARQFKGKDLESAAELTEKNTKAAKCDRTLQQCIEGLDAAWFHSVVVTANLMFKDFNISNGYVFHRGSPEVEKVYAEFRKFKASSGLSGEDKWNPADIWAIKNGYNHKTGFTTLQDYNKYVYDQFKSKQLIGISLKKVPKGAAHSKIFNDGKPPAAKFKEVKAMSDVIASKDVYWDLEFDGNEARVQLRNFSSRPVTSSWQGEIKGKSASGGKIGGGLLIKAAKESGIANVNMPNQFNPLAPVTAPIATKFAEMYLAISNSQESKKDVIQKTMTMAKIDQTWWMSKYLGVYFTYTVMTSKKQNAVAGWLYNYASSATSTSSIFVKYSD